MCKMRANLCVYYCNYNWRWLFCTIRLPSMLGIENLEFSNWLKLSEEWADKKQSDIKNILIYIIIWCSTKSCVTVLDNV